MKIKVRDLRRPNCGKQNAAMVRCMLPKRHKGRHSWERAK